MFDSKAKTNSSPVSLKSNFTPLGMWAFSIGTSIGWGSFIVTCNTYLLKSGILGTVFGMLIGMAIILIITRNLYYMINKSPSAGGIYTFTKKTAGNDLGFLAFWFVLLSYMAVLWANVTSLPLFARFFLGETFKFGFHYTVFGYEVWLGEALLSICAVLLVGLLCANSSRLTNSIMIAAALLFAVGFTVCAVWAMIKHDSSFSYAPLYTEGSTPFSQIVRIAAISPWAFIGFENISHFSEEYKFPVKKIRGVLICSVIITTVLYLFVSFLSISAYPPEYGSWIEYISDMGNLDGIKAVPAFYAANYYLGSRGVTLLMFSLFGVIITSFIGNMLALSRLFYAAGREGDAPKWLSVLNKRRIPSNAIIFIAFVSVLIPFLGRTAIGWIVDVTTLGGTLIYGLISYSAYRSAKAENRKAEMITGVSGLILMVVFIVLLLVPGLLPFDAMASESYVLFIVWSLLGLIYFRAIIRKNSKSSSKQRILVWIILLVLVLFASMMWVSRATENAANSAVEQIFQYHQTHSGSDKDEYSIEEREEYLHEQAKQITDTNTLYSAVSLGFFILSVGIMFVNYKDTQKLGERLSAAEKEVENAKKIEELKKTIDSLIDNIPGMTFAKDAETGVYIACNQAFAKYADKATPEDVIGYTDSELFSPATAEQLMNDDRITLSMDEPYIFYENISDANGNELQLQTTKLKYVDANGRLCTLGISQDVTDMIRIQHENATTKEAYEKAKLAGIMYTHIAKTLARSYSELFYVNLETEEYIEYLTDDENDSLAESRRGDNFFEQCRKDAQKLIHPYDRDIVIASLDKNKLIEVLNRDGIFIITYRLANSDGPKYVTMKVSRMKDDERIIIIGISDVDEQMKDRRAAERAMEERIAYKRVNALAGDYICIYVVVPETGRYREFSSTGEYDTYNLSKEGDDFFAKTRETARSALHPDDVHRFLSAFTKEAVFEEIQRSGMFTLTYRIVLQGKPVYVQLKAAMVDEKDGKRLVVGLNNIDSHIRQEEEHAKRLEIAQTKANLDALTGVKNKHAYLDAEEKLDMRIQEHECPEFAIVMLDVNDLKIINDTKGHSAGDKYIKDACEIVCSTFKRSPVFRVGGDEFAVIVQGEDYNNLDKLIGKINEHNTRSIAAGGIVIACGYSKFDGDDFVASVFERADNKMYENKNALKTLNEK